LRSIIFALSASWRLWGKIAEHPFYPQIGKRFNDFSWLKKDRAKAGLGLPVACRTASLNHWNRSGSFAVLICGWKCFTLFKTCRQTACVFFDHDLP